MDIRFLPHILSFFGAVRLNKQMNPDEIEGMISSDVEQDDLLINKLYDEFNFYLVPAIASY
jgi:hypothetical protein